jgi:hypothetical protein
LLPQPPNPFAATATAAAASIAITFGCSSCNQSCHCRVTFLLGLLDNNGAETVFAFTSHRWNILHGRHVTIVLPESVLLVVRHFADDVDGFLFASKYNKDESSIFRVT